MNAPRRTVRACELTIELGERPWLMGIVNAAPDSFSDGGLYPDLDARVALAERLLRDGADVIDIGGESASTGPEPVAVEEEIERVAPLVEKVAGTLGALVSVDTYKPQVASAAIAAGARIVNDVSGLRDPALAEVCARSGAALVLMHTRAAPRQRLQDPDLYDDVAGEVLAFLRERIERALAAGCQPEQLIVDPGPDFAKTPAQTIRLLRELPRQHELGRPLRWRLAQGLHRGLTARAARVWPARWPRSPYAPRRGAHLPRPRRRRGGFPAGAGGARGRALEVEERLALSEELRLGALGLEPSSGCPVLANVRGRQPPSDTKARPRWRYSSAPSWKQAPSPTFTRSPTRSGSTASEGSARPT